MTYPESSTLPPQANWEFIFSNFAALTSSTRSSKTQRSSFAYPASMYALSGIVLLTMAFYNFLLKCCNTCWRHWSKRQRQPICGSFTRNCIRLLYDTDDPESLLKRTMLKITKQTVSATLDADDLPPIKPYKRATINSTRPNPYKRALLATLGVLAAQGSMGDTMSLRSERLGRTHLRKYRGHNGMLETKQLDDDALTSIHDTIRNDNSAFLTAVRPTARFNSEAFLQTAQSQSNAFYTIVDTGCSTTCSNDKNDFEPGTLAKLAKPKTIGGIAGNITVEYEGMISWETLGDDGNIVVFRTKALYAPQLPCRLFSPQSFLTSSQNLDDHFRVYKDRSEWHMFGRKLITLSYDSSFLPRMTLFKPGTAETTLNAMTGGVLEESNQNLNPLKRIWLMWHFRLGHLAFAHVQSLGLGGFLDRHALSILREPLQKVPKCAACQFGKQSRTPSGTTHIRKDALKEGGLKKDKLRPGQLVFMDQLDSRLRGRLPHTSGREHQIDQFRGSTVFCDAASGLIHVEHQVSFTAAETLTSKISFERMAADHGTRIDGYHTDNGVFKSREFMQALADDAQPIRFSGVGAKWQNGVAENSIKIVVSKARTMMIHASLHWPDEYDESLWPMAVSYASHLYNHTPNRNTGVAPIETFTKTLSNYQVLRNAHVWGCPVYVLEPRLSESGGKLPKWQPRSRRGQFLGMSPVHSECISTVRNLRTGYITPQFHVVVDEWFETVSSSLSSDHEEPEPKHWEHMTIFQRFQTVFDDDQTAPRLADEWLTKEEIASVPPIAEKHQHPRHGRRVSQASNQRDDRDDRSFQPPKTPARRELPSALPREPSSALPREPSRALQREPVTPAPTINPALQQPDPVRSSPKARYPSRDRSSTIASYDPSTGDTVNTSVQYSKPGVIGRLATAMLATSSILTQHLIHLRALGTDPHTGFQESFHPCTIQSELALKAKKTSDPDLPSIREALTGNHAADFFKAMDLEIANLEGMGTWEITERKNLTADTKVIPGTWSFRVKRYPDGRLNKFKSRFCVRGDMMLKGEHYEDAYSPVVGWPTVRSCLIMAASLNLHTRQVDFVNAFCQAEQKEPLFIELPAYYKVKGRENEDLVLSLKKSLYGNVTAPKAFYEHITAGMKSQGFVQSPSDPCLFIHKEDKVMVLQYVDDQIWIAPNARNIIKHVEQLKQKKFLLTMEDDGDMFGFLGITVNRDQGTIELTQQGLTDKVLKYVGLHDSKSKDTPAALDPLGSDKDGEEFEDEWSYPAAVGMLLYLSSNTRPDIQFAVHQCARFTHSPKQSHGQAIKRICRYLAGTQDKGILFTPNLKEGLNCYVDADYAGLFSYEDPQDPVSVKSRTGFVLTLFGCPLLWSSKLQTEISLSSTAAEYVAFSMSMRELIPMRRLVQELGTILQLEIAVPSLVRSTVFEDNQGCLSLVNVPKMSPRNKYLALKYHFFRDHIGLEKGIVAQYIRSEIQKADIFTKSLPTKDFERIRKLLMGW